MLHALHDDLLSLIGGPTKLYGHIQHQACQLHLSFTEVHEHRIHHELKLVHILVVLQCRLEQLSQRSQDEDLIIQQQKKPIYQNPKRYQWWPSPSTCEARSSHPAWWIYRSPLHRCPRITNHTTQPNQRDGTIMKILLEPSSWTHRGSTQHLFPPTWHPLVPSPINSDWYRCTTASRPSPPSST